MNDHSDPVANAHRIELTLLCDHKTCTRQVGAVAHTEDMAKALLLERAKAARWSRRFHVSCSHACDLCPDHENAPQEEIEFHPLRVP